MSANLVSDIIDLKKYIESQKFKGWDPYDGLNSKVFNAIPLLNRSAVFRLVWIQLFKRNPINLRNLFFVPKEYNSKGIALILQAYCNLHTAVLKNPELSEAFGSKESLRSQIIWLSDLLEEMVSPGFSGAAWGYNFPWQCRREFLFPANEPTVVATHFCASALFAAYDTTGIEKYRTTALSSAAFVINDLRRTPHKDGFLFSYSPMPGNDTIYNASLLGSRLLCLCHKYGDDASLLELARKSVIACCQSQNEDGSWTYGVKSVTGWIDSFHTGYNLDSLATYREISGDNSFEGYLNKGTEYYIKNFFNEDGSPKYYNDKQFPIDIHCPAQFFVSMSRLGRFVEQQKMIEKVLSWSNNNMKSSKGYYYYQLKKGISSKISYMRWSNAFMLYALSFLINEMIDNDRFF